jgi:hypothetical protein
VRPVVELCQLLPAGADTLLLRELWCWWPRCCRLLRHGCTSWWQPRYCWSSLLDERVQQLLPTLAAHSAWRSARGCPWRGGRGWRCARRIHAVCAQSHSVHGGSLRRRHRLTPEHRVAERFSEEDFLDGVPPIPRRNRSSKEPGACRQCKHGRSNAWVDARERPSETVVTRPIDLAELEGIACPVGAALQSGRRGALRAEQDVHPVRHAAAEAALCGQHVGCRQRWTLPSFAGIVASWS